MRTPKSFFRGKDCQWVLLSVCAHVWDYPDQVQHLALGISWGSCGPASHVCSAPSGWHSILVLCQLPSANLLAVHSIRLSGPLIKILKSKGPKMEPWGTKLITSIGLRLDIEPLTTAVQLCPSSQVLMNYIIHPSNLCLSNLEIGMSCGKWKIILIHFRPDLKVNSLKYYLGFLSSAFRKFLIWSEFLCSY